MCVPKRESTDFRIIHDLSFSEYSSVNSGIPTNFYLSENRPARQFYPKQAHGCKIFKRDIRRAFRQIAVDPKDVPLLGFQVDNQIYFHCVLPFGGRSCVLCCHRTTELVVYILAEEDISTDVYIDDFLGAETP